MKRVRTLHLLMIIAAVVVVVQLFSVKRTSASTFTVTTTADNGNNASPTPGSLRQAIIFANNTPGLDTINFNIPGSIINIPTIIPPAFLPEITSPVILDGTTQGLFGLVELDGESAGSGQLVVSGLVVTAGASTIKGLVINRFSNNGITLASSGNTVQGCYIGTDVSGTTGSGNGTRGILINGTSLTAANNLIGGTTEAARNVISGNSSVGIEIFGSGATGNLVQGNYIGTDVNGAAALGNNFGVFIDGGAGQNTIGGSAAGARNVISGNGLYGIEIFQNGPAGNTVAGNYIGTDVSGTAALGNGGSLFGGGVAIIRSSNNEIGAGLLPGNVISGNNGLPPNTGGFGVFIQGDSSLPATGNQVVKNLIGTNAAGTAALANANDGVLVDGSSSESGATGNAIGLAGFGNLISGNGRNGIRISTGSSNTVEGNRIGTDVNGSARLQNAVNGVLIQGLGAHSIGGTGAGAGNLISGNGQNGIEIDNGGPNGGSLLSNKVTGNFIGTNAAGTSALGNGMNGVFLLNTRLNDIGGASSAARNVISGNVESGVLISGGINISVFSNFIGTNAAGNAALGNGRTGVRIDSAQLNFVFDNVISANGTQGIEILGNANATLNQVKRNRIGTDAAGNATLGNAFDGVYVAQPNNQIGSNSEGNLIAGNQRDGIEIVNGATGIFISSNSIFANGQMGIDLAGDGVTANDPCDGDTGENNRQNYPVISSITRAGSSITINGSLNSTAGTQFLIEFFSSPSCSPSGNGEGKTLLGVTSVTTNGACLASFSVTLNAPPAGESIITATARRVTALSDTSEFSACATAPTAIAFAGATANAYDDGVLIEWQTGLEIDNLGFNLYRETAGKRVLLNSQPVAGSALLVGPDTVLGAGYSYAWWEAGVANDHSAAYWIEDLDLNGQRTWHGPIAVTEATGPPPAEKLKQARLLSELGRTETDSAPIETRSRLPVGEALKASRLESAQSEFQNRLAGEPAVKISVKQEGWYRVTQPELIQAGLDANADPRSLQLYADGEPIPIFVAGENDGRFDADDAIEFYGLGLDSPATDTRVYWLIVGAEAGLRIARRQSPAPPIQAGNFPFTVERRDRTVYFASLTNGETENFFGAIIAAQPVTQSLNVLHPDTEAALGATLEVTLQGVTRVPHLVRVQLNGSDLGQIIFDGQAQGAARFSVSPQLLKAGLNQVTLTALSGPGDVALVDHLRLTYNHTTTADNNQLKLSASGGQMLTVDGFTNEQIRLFDVTDPAAAQEFIGTTEKREDGYAVSLTVPGNGQRALLVLTDDQAKRAASVRANAPSNWRGATAEADLIIIHRNMGVALAPLVALRQRQGLKVAAVDVEDLFDEFSFGEKSPQAIKDFLVDAGTRWKKRLHYLLIVGDASYDPKNYLGLGDSDLVPTRLIDTSYMEAASDDWFADLDNDDVPELAVGRLPVQTQEEAAAMIMRLIAYEASRPADETLLVADMVDGYNFEDANAQLKALLPGDVKAVEIKRGELGERAKPALIAALNRGPRIANYTGHGSVDQWRGNLLTSADAGVLMNQEQLSLFVMMSCLNGYFDNPARDSLAESLLKAPRGGAVAVWASSAMTSPVEQSLLNRALYRQLFGNRSIRIGAAVRAAKTAITDQDARRTWILLGDPTLRLK